VTDNRLCGGTEDNSAQAGAAMRRNYNQIDLALAGHAHNFGSRVSMHDNFFDLEAIEFVAVGKFGQLALS
jgi:hypothetical protein